MGDPIFGPTPSQTVGPFFHDPLAWSGGDDLVGTSGVDKPIELRGTVRDGAGAPVPDAMIEIWQANGEGRYSAVGFIGFGRAATSANGNFRFRTIMPGRVPGPNGVLQAPHIAVSVFGRGLLKRLATRVYFANEEDPILAFVPAARRGTLIAERSDDGTWRWDITLRGEGETVFFDL